MNPIFPKFLFVFFIFQVFEMSAENWHPFPFKIAYYGTPHQFHSPVPAQDSLMKGLLIDALYLDTNYQTDTIQSRARSSLYLPLVNTNNGSFVLMGSFLGNPIVHTSSDSSRVEIENSSGLLPIGPFFPKKVKMGQSPFFGNGPVIGISTQLIFGILDSVATIQTGSIQYSWSKRFGIIKIATEDAGNENIIMVLSGVNDWDLGWKDQTNKMLLPSIGDEFHIWRVGLGQISCTGQFGNSTVSENFNKLLRIKVLQLVAGGIKAEVVESVPGASTGILYEATYEYFSYENFSGVRLEDSIGPIGVRSNFWDYSFGFISDQGNHFKVAKVEWVDLPPYYFFVSCVKAPWSTINIEGRNSIPPFQICQGTLQRVDYPVYYKIAGGCETGVPFPLVTITSVKNEVSNPNGIQIIPNPATNQFRFEGLTSGKYEIHNLQGGTVKHGRIGEGNVDITNLPSGLYLYSVQSESGSSNGKILKE